MIANSIQGIQQVGIGNTNVRETMLMYKELFGMSALVFDEAAEAPLMTQYTGGIVQSRRAALTMNMAGGGGFEIWQFTSRFSKPPEGNLQLGDLGIFAAKIKTQNIEKAHQHLSSFQGADLSQIFISPNSGKHFWLTDKNQNVFQIVECEGDWFNKAKNNIGGVLGAVIGVSDMEKALRFYKEALAVDEIIYDHLAAPTDVPNEMLWNEGFCRRVLLCKPKSTEGAFSNLLGEVQIELFEVKNKPLKKIFENRYWGDCGFIHLCFDVNQMDALKQKMDIAGFPFTIDSENSFAMEGAAGRFSYAEDPDGTLIEFVETHKVPILKKWGWYLHLYKRKTNKPLPGWMVNMLGMNKVK